MMGDCLIEMKNIPDNSVDMILADPPFGQTRSSWDILIPFEPMWEQLKRVTKPNGAIVLFGMQPFTSALVMSNLTMFKYDWVWAKSKPTGFLNAKKQPLRETETISVFYKKQCTYNPQGVTQTNKMVSRTNRGNYGDCSKTTLQTVTNYPRSILRFATIDGLHPTQKPLDLGRYLIRTYTNEGDTVLDFTLGSGTFGVGSVLEKRNFIGIELDPRYFAMANTRIADAVDEMMKENYEHC